MSKENKELGNILEEVACNLCGSDDKEFVFSGHDRQYVTVPDNVICNVVRCRKCGLMFLSPRVKEEYIGKFYPTEEYYAYKPIRQNRQHDTLKDELFYLVAKLILKYPASDIEKQIYAKKIYLKALAWLAYNFMGFHYRRIWPYQFSGRLFEIGFGSGQYILRMQKLGWECWGSEINSCLNEKMSKQGIRSFQNLWDPQIPTGYFDWVVAYHSLEHVFNPMAYLQRLFAILKPGGKYILEFPIMTVF